MNVILISITRMQSLDGESIYQNLMRKFRDEGHSVYVVTAYERQYGLRTSLKEVDGIHILGIRTLNNQKTNVVEKGLSMLTLETLYIRAMKKYLKGIPFDIIISSTPPISLTKAVCYIKRLNPNSYTYLLLKDIFPQNAVDLGMFGKNSLFHKYFRRKEIELYRAFDYIGCMSPANVEYLLKHNPEICPSKVEVAPNCADISRTVKESFDKDALKRKYNLPVDKPILVYGGNLGKPQGIPYLVRCLDANKDREDCHFVVVGGGTDYPLIETWIHNNNPQNISLFKTLPKHDYDRLVQCCDIGLIFLDYRFTIPNYPSRLLAYLENKTPIIAATDANTDIGSIAQENGYGFWCESINENDFTLCVNRMLDSDIKGMGQKGYDYLVQNYLSSNTYNTIISHIK